MPDNQTNRQQLQTLWRDLERYQRIMGNDCPNPNCNELCCHFEASGMMPCTTGTEWNAIKEYLEENAIDLPLSQGLDCPFLENSRCQIYVVRPTGCRIFFCNLQDREFQGLLPWLEKAKEIDPPNQAEYRPILDWFYNEY